MSVIVNEGLAACLIGKLCPSSNALILSAVLTPDRAGIGSLGHPEVAPLHKVKAERVVPDAGTLVTEVRGTHTLAIHNYVLVAVSCKSVVKSICPGAVFLLSTENVGKLLHKLVKKVGLIVLVIYTVSTKVEGHNGHLVSIKVTLTLALASGEFADLVRALATFCTAICRVVDNGYGVAYGLAGEGYVNSLNACVSRGEGVALCKAGNIILADVYTAKNIACGCGCRAFTLKNQACSAELLAYVEGSLVCRSVNVKILIHYVRNILTPDSNACINGSILSEYDLVVRSNAVGAMLYRHKNGLGLTGSEGNLNYAEILIVVNTAELKADLRSTNINEVHSYYSFFVGKEGNRTVEALSTRGLIALVIPEGYTAVSSSSVRKSYECRVCTVIKNNVLSLNSGVIVICACITGSDTVRSLGGIKVICLRSICDNAVLISKETLVAMLGAGSGKTTATELTNTVETAYAITVCIIAMRYLNGSIGVRAGGCVPMVACILGIGGLIGMSVTKRRNCLGLSISAIGTGIGLYTVNSIGRLGSNLTLIKAMVILNDSIVVSTGGCVPMEVSIAGPIGSKLVGMRELVYGLLLLISAGLAEVRGNALLLLGGLLGYLALTKLVSILVL